jgi:hypothetical protein
MAREEGFCPKIPFLRTARKVKVGSIPISLAPNNLPFPGNFRGLLSAGKLVFTSYSALSNLISVPDRTFLKAFGSPRTFPSGLTALAGLGLGPLLTGVGPKKIQNA